MEKEGVVHSLAILCILWKHPHLLKDIFNVARRIHLECCYT